MSGTSRRAPGCTVTASITVSSRASGLRPRERAPSAAYQQLPGEVDPACKETATDALERMLSWQPRERRPTAGGHRSMSLVSCSRGSYEGLPAGTSRLGSRSPIRSTGHQQ